MKKASLFLSVAWLAMATMSIETHAAGTQAPQTGWKAKLASFNPLKKKLATPVVTSASLGEAIPAKQPAVAAGAGEGVGSETPVTATPALQRSSSGLGSLFGRRRANSAHETIGAVAAPLEQAPMAPKAAEAEDIKADMDLSLTLETPLDKTRFQNTNGIENLFAYLDKPMSAADKVKAKAYSSKKCSDWRGFYPALIGHKDTRGSNCAKNFCSTNCAPANAATFFAEGTLGEAICVYRCARGVSMGGSNQRFKAIYTATSTRPIWNSVLSYWQNLEGISNVTNANLVDDNAEAATLSEKRIAALSTAKKAAAKSQSPAEVRAEKELGAAGVAMTEAYVKFKLAADDIQKKAKDLDSTIQKTETAIKEAQNQGFDDNRINKTISDALKSGGVSLRQYGRLFRGQLGFVNALDDVRAGKTLQHDQLLETVKKYEGAYAKLQTILAKEGAVSGSTESASTLAGPTASAAPTEIENGLQAIIDGGTSEGARGKARKDFINGYKDKVALKKALLALEVQNSLLGKEATAMLKRSELKDVVVQ